MSVRPAPCDRARLWASLALDGELTELEERALQAHLRACEPCAALAHALGAIADGLRGTEPEPVVRPAALPRPEATRPRRLRRVREVTSAAAALLLVVSGTTALLAARDHAAPSRDPNALLSPFYADPKATAAEERARRLREAMYRRNLQQPEASRPTVPGPVAD